MPRVRVVLVRPQSEGNVGAVARAMYNFGLEALFIVDPQCELGLEARRRAMHADGVLANATVHDELGTALGGVDMVVGTSGVKTENEKKFGRIAITPREFAEKISEHEGKVAILFGQEDFGLDIETIRRCDLLVSIPTSEKYPIMNLSHAAAVVFYELFASGADLWHSEHAGKMEIDRLAGRFGELLETIDYPEHKKSKTKLMFRRIVGRAILSNWEYHTLMGVLKGAITGRAQEEDETNDDTIDQA